MKKKKEKEITLYTDVPLNASFLFHSRCRHFDRKRLTGEPESNPITQLNWRGVKGRVEERNIGSVLRAQRVTAEYHHELDLIYFDLLYTGSRFCSYVPRFVTACSPVWTGLA